MVAVVVGSRLGLEQTSAWVLGSRGQLGSAALGRAGENVFVNAATGNLIVNNRDEFLIGLGGDAAISRTYNSLGAVDGDNDDGWHPGVTRELYDLVGTPNAAGSSIHRLAEDGSRIQYFWDAGRGAYVSKEGGGAFDTIAFDGNVWTWTDGDSGTAETFSYASNYKVLTSRDRDGNTTTYSYNGAGRVSRVTTADGSYTDLTWSGANLTQVTTTYYDGPTSSWKSLTRVRYGYDGSNRLTTVTVDLSPDDNTIADGRTYVTTYTYDGASKRVASISQTDGSRVDITYETGGPYRVTSISQAVADGVTRVTRFGYYSTTRTDVTDANGGVTRMEFDAAGQLTKITEPEPAAGAPAPVQEFIYTADGDIFRIKTGPDSWTDFFYYTPSGGIGLWTSRYERTSAGYITTQRTYNAANAILTETRYDTLDPDDGGAAYQPSGPMTTRYAYDSENHLRFVVSATGAVTRYDYAPNGNLIRSTAFTGARYNIAGLAVGDTIPAATLDSWAAGLADKTAAQITETVYDFRGNISQTIAYSTVLATGGADAGSPATRTNYIYDQAGKLLSRHVTGLSNAETFIYDGLGRMVSAVDFNGSATTTAFHDALGTTVVRLADGLNQVSVYNKAGEVVSYSESERGANLVNLQGWPEYDPNFPGVYADQPAWPTYYNWETRWQTTMGPDGRPVAAMQAGQLDTGSAGGGSHTNNATIDASKTYEFVFYFKKSDLTKHYLYFGLSGSNVANPYVEHASGAWGGDSNPYFMSMDPGAQQTVFQQDKWYKVVGYVLPQGSANIPVGQMGGVYDVETDQKVYDVQNFRWSASRPDNQVHARFFDHYNENELGFSTYFYKPEMRRTDQPSVNLINLSGWPGPAEPPPGPAVPGGWYDAYTHMNAETRWQYIDGPDGRQVAAIQAGQYDQWDAGGGSHTNEFTIDASKDYEFVYYFRKNDLDKHIVYFGLSGSEPAYVRNAGGDGSVSTNPYFVYFNSSGSSYNTTTYQPIQEDRWYKVVGHVYAQGSTNASSSSSGVFDAETGQKMADVANFRWDAGRPNNSIRSRFFDYYEHTELGFSTYFYKPEVHSFDQPSVNLIDLSGWAPPPPNSGPASVEGWNNMWMANETRWHVTDGPEGRKVMAIQAGQFDQYDAGGGNYTNSVTIDGSKAYEFTIYVKREDLDKHYLYWGLSYNDPPYVDSAFSGAADTNPYFYAASSATQRQQMIEDRWYKIVGYVLPQGSANLTWAQAPGGVYDTVTGVKVADVNSFRWRADRPDNQVYGRFFNYYEHTQKGWSTSFYKPEIREVDLAATPNLVDNSGWPQGSAPPGYANPCSWNNPAATTFAQETRWQLVNGPTGGKIVAIEAGQTAANAEGGGGATNKVKIDKTSAYKFVFYFRKPDLSKHNIYFGLSDYNDPAYVEYLSDGSSESNPYFVSLGASDQPSILNADKWYRVEGYVLPAGSQLTHYDYGLGGIFDVETGQKVAGAYTFRWKDTLPGDQVAARFFTFYGESTPGYSTYFGQPEIHKVDVSALLSLQPADSTRYRYDKLGRLRMATDPTGRSTHYIFDNVGRKVGEVDADGSLSEYKYDSTGRLVATVRYATRLTAQDIATLTDGMGNPAPTEVAWIRPNAHADDAWSWNVYDGAGRLLQTIDGAGGSTAHEYDGASRLVRTTARATAFTAGQIAAFKTISPTTLQIPGDSGSDRVTRYFFDADGRQIGTLDAEGFFRRLTYDAAGRVIQTSTFANQIAVGLRAAGTYDAILTSVNSSADDIHTWSVYDGRGFLKGAVNGEGEVTLYDYTPLGHVSQVQTGRKLASILSSQPTLAQLVAAPPSPVLETTTYTRNPLGQVLTETRALASGSEVVTYTYDSLHRLTGQSLNRVTGADYENRQRYDRRGRLTGQLSGEGSAALAALGGSPTKAQVDGVYRKWGTTFGYDAADRLISRTDPDGIDGAGFTTFYFYEADGALAYEVNALGEVQGHVYDARNRRTQTIAFGTHMATAGLKGGNIVAGLPSRTSITSADSRTILAYNVTGTVASSTDALGASTLYNYNAFGELANRHDPFGPSTATVTTFAYDRRGLTTQTVEDAGGLNRTRTLAYDAFGRANHEVDPRGYARTTLYDRAGRVRVHKDAFNNQTAYAYDARGHVITITDRLGKVTTLARDAFGRHTTMTTAEGLVTTTSFDDQGHALSVTDGAGRNTSYAYDLDGQLKTVTNGLGQQDVNSYDPAGRLYETTDASGVKVRYGYDGAGRVLTETVDPTGLNLTTRYAYDAKGQRVWIIDPSGVRTDYVFDLAGRTTQVIVDAASLVLRTIYSYDRAGNVVSVDEAAGAAAEKGTNYVYDALGRLTSQQTGDVSLNIRSAYDYDANGNVVRRLDGVSTGVDVATRYVYDAENRLILTIDPVGAVTRNHYDAEGRIVRTTGYVNPVSLSGTALTEGQVLGALGSSPYKWTDYVYDDDGRLVFTRNAAGQVTELARDGAGKIVRQTDYVNTYVTGSVPAEAELRGWLAVYGSASDRTSLAAYDAAGRQTYAIDAAGQVTAFAYDGAGRVIRTRQHAVLNTANGVMSHATLEGWAAANAHALDRVTRTAWDTAGRAAFTVDAEGYVSRTTYDAAGKVASQSCFTPVVSVSDGVSAATVASLVAAHESTAATTSYSYDTAGRLKYKTDAVGVTSRFDLDGLGRTTWIWEAIGTADQKGTAYAYDDGGRLITEIRAYGEAEQQVYTNVYDGLGRLLTEVRADGHAVSRTYDAMGRVLTVTVPISASQTAVTTNTWDAFGNLVKVVDPRGNTGFFYYNVLDQLTLQIDAEGYATETAYSRGGEVRGIARRAARVSGTPSVQTIPTIVTGPGDAVTTIFHDKLDRVIATTDAQGHTESYELNAFGDRTKVTNKLGGQTLYTYDRRGLMLSEQLPITSLQSGGVPANVVNQFQYDARGNLTKTIEAAGLGEARTTNYVYDKLDRLIQKSGDAVTVTSSVDFTTSTVTPTEHIVHDKRSNVIETRDAAGARTLFFYDDHNRKTAEIDALGTLRTWTYDLNNNATVARTYDTPVALPATPGGTAPAGSGNYRETLNTYDRNNRLTQSKIASNVWVGEATASAYISSYTDVVTNMAYDAAGNVTAIDHGDGAAAFSFYDRLGRQIAAVDGEGYLTAYERDAEGNVTREVRYATRVGGTVTAGRDPSTLPPNTPSSSVGDRITDFTYDRNGRRLTEVRRGVAVYSAGATDRLTVADSSIAYAYDGLGNVTMKVEANGDYVEYAYDLIGRQTAATRSAFIDFQGNSVRRRTATTWNGWSGVTRIEDGEQSAPAAQNRVTFFSYGAGGRLGATTDATGFVRYFGHDAAGRVTRESWTRTQGDGSTITEGHRYTYDLKGQVTFEGSGWHNGSSWIWADTRSNAYNAHGEVTAKGMNGLWQERFEYDKAGRLYRSTAGDGVARVYLHDRAGQVSMTVASTGADISGWDAGNIIGAFTGWSGYAIGAYDVPGVAATFTSYDRRGLVTGTREPFRQLSRDLSSGAYTTTTMVRSRTLNAFGEVTSETDARGGVTDFTYNTMGRIIETRRPTVAFTNEQGVVSSARPTEQSRFDISGRLVATRTANGYWTSRTLLAGSGHNGEEAIAAGQLNPDGGSITYGADVFGDIRKVTDQLGFVTLNDYDKAGRLISVQHPGRAAWTPGNPTGAAVQLIDYFAYDGLGQRIQHWNNQFGSGYAERTHYDTEGRVTWQSDFETRWTQYTYAWDSTLTTTGLGTFGGWIKTSYNPSGKTSVDRTDYFGRVTARTDLGGRTYAMGFDLGGRLVSQTSSAGQSLTWSWYNTGLTSRQLDNVTGAQADYAYDAAGQRVRERYYASGALRQDGYATFDAMGRMTEFKDVSDNASDPTRTLWTYDLNGNVRSSQTNYRKVDAAPSSATFATSPLWNRYDALDRMVHVEGSLSDGEIRLGRRLEYDAVGNRVRMLTESSVGTDIQTGWGEVWVPDDPGGGGGMEELPQDPGGGGGHYEYYPIYESRAGWAVENYDYTADGYLARVGRAHSQWDTNTDTVVMGATSWISEDVRDAMGRLTLRTETSGEQNVGTSYSRQATYDKSGLITWEQTYTYLRDDAYTNTTARFNTSTTTYNYFEGSTWRGVVTSVTTAGYTDPWPQGGSTTPVASTRTDYAYNWWDDARQSSITYDSDTGSGSNGLHTSSFTYDVNGRVSSVYIADARPRTVAFVTDAQGQVLTRAEADNNPNLADPIDRYYYFSGQRIGQTTNNVQYGTNYYGEMYNRGWVGPTTPTPFRSGNYAQYGVDFDLAYEALTPNSVRTTGQTWTVRDGDTLQGMAAATWGDASLWYLIAEANGLTSASILTAGQTLTIPARAGNVHNNADTFRPYDPNEALGNLNPTQPKPPKKAGGCGMIGQIIMVAIAVAVAAIVAPYAIAAMANVAAGAGTFTGAGILAGTTTVATATGTVSVGLGAFVAGGAVAGAAGSIASQAFGVATGIQEKFDWKGVALSALSSAVSAGLGSVMKVAKGASETFEAIKRGALGSVITQGVAVATGLQDKFSWTSVAVSAVGAGVGQAVSDHLPAGYDIYQKGFVSSLAGGVAGAATQSVIDGTSFGDNIVAILPSVIGNTIGNMVAGGLQAKQAEAKAANELNKLNDILANREAAPSSATDRAFVDDLNGRFAEAEGFGLERVVHVVNGPDGAKRILPGAVVDYLTRGTSGMGALETKRQIEANILALLDTVGSEADNRYIGNDAIMPALAKNGALVAIYASLGKVMPEFQWTHVGAFMANQVREELINIHLAASAVGVGALAMPGGALGNMAVTAKRDDLINTLVEGQVSVVSDLASMALSYRAMEAAHPGQGATMMSRAFSDNANVRDAFNLQAQADRAFRRGDIQTSRQLGRDAAYQLGVHEQIRLQRMWNDLDLNTFAKVNAGLIDATGPVGWIAEKMARPIGIYVGVNRRTDGRMNLGVIAPPSNLQSRDVSSLEVRLAIAGNAFDYMLNARNNPQQWRTVQGMYDRMLNPQNLYRLPAGPFHPWPTPGHRPQTPAPLRPRQI